MKSPDRGRRDWSLLIFIVPIGALLMLLVGQLAIRILPFWSVNAGMNSNLDPGTESPRPFSLFQPILPQILTPMAWAGTYLTPSGDISFPPFFVFEPGAPNSPTPVSPTPTSPTPIVTATTASLTPIASTNPPPVVITTKPPDPQPTDPPPTDPPPTDPPPTDPPPTDPPPTDPPPTDPPPTDPPPTDPPPTDPPPTEPIGYPSTPDPDWSYVPPPPGVGVGPPDGNTGGINQGKYTILDLGSSPITVDGSFDYDMVYYEDANGSRIYLDNVIIGISNSTPSCGSVFYVVFNWGDVSGVLTNDFNTNLVGFFENDNEEIPLSALYNYPISPSTGILINVDHAASQPPNGVYTCVVLASPYKAGTDAVSTDGIEIFP